MKNFVFLVCLMVGCSSYEALNIPITKHSVSPQAQLHNVWAEKTHHGVLIHGEIKFPADFHPDTLKILVTLHDKQSHILKTLEYFEYPPHKPKKIDKIGTQHSHPNPRNLRKKISILTPYDEEDLGKIDVQLMILEKKLRK